MKTAIKVIMTLLTITFLMDTTQATVLSTPTEETKSKTLFSKTYGSDNGQPFMLPASRAAVLSVCHIKKISIKHGRRIEKIQMNWVNKEGKSSTQSTGENGGTWSHITLAKNEYIVKVKGRSGSLVDQLTFYTNKGRRFGPYGGTGGKAFTIDLPTDAQVIGFAGRSGQAIDRFGLIYVTGGTACAASGTVTDHRPGKGNGPVANPAERPRPTPRPAKEIPGRYNLPDNLRPSFEEVAVWRLQLRVKTSTVENADSDSGLHVQFRNNASSIYYLDKGGDDREKNQTDTYDILDPNIKTIRDILFMKFLIKGNDAWCIAKIELLVNGAPIPVFTKAYANRQCIDGNSAPGPGLYISGSELRNSPTWKHFNNNRAIWLPPSIIKRSTLENMVESYVGHMMKTDPTMKKNDLKYGFRHGNRYVEATKKANNKLHFDLDLKSHYGIDFEVDVDFDLVIDCENNKLSLKAESVKGEADIPILSSILNVFDSCLLKMKMNNFNFGNANLPFCPRVKVTNAGDVTLSL